MRGRRVLGEIERECQKCGRVVPAELYESWEREHGRYFGWRKKDVRKSARCLVCGYRVILGATG